MQTYIRTRTKPPRRPVTSPSRLMKLTQILTDFYVLQSLRQPLQLPKIEATDERKAA